MDRNSVSDLGGALAIGSIAFAGLILLFLKKLKDLAHGAEDVVVVDDKEV